ncbi:MAG: M56 family metallopeptidase, partial [Acidobacteriaceae bacterium]|nr:M56 family metallopeptidase [Acidobacteriaceae bacterium]
EVCGEAEEQMIAFLSHGALSHGTWAAALVQHLWQSTIVCLALWLLALMLRRNDARVRFRLWLLASVKFLLPFGLLIAASGSLSSRHLSSAPAPYFSFVVEGPAAQPSAAEPAPPALSAQAAMTVTQPVVHAKSRSIWPLFLVLWALGSCTVLSLWCWCWWRVRAIARSGERLPDLAGLKVVMVPSHVEPGVFGVFCPVLLLPRGVRDRLTPLQFEAIVAHELSHARRRDNLTAALHMVVSAVFWFHPFVWWIGRELFREREAACDEAVVERNHSSHVYAEGILNVCKFYKEGPLTCVSGVSGVDLKNRLVRILSERVAEKLNFARKLVLGAAAVLCVALPVTFGALHASKMQAQTPAKQNIDDTWQGTLHVPQMQKDLRQIFKITKAPDGTLKTLYYSIDQAAQPIPVKETTFQGGELKVNVEVIGGTYTGKMSADGTTVTGQWEQGGAHLPLILVRATPETAWAIPEPPAKIPPMAANADPSFEVATIKPSDPATKGKVFTFKDATLRHFIAVNVTLNDMINFAYGLNSKQIVGGPAWMESDKFDVDTGQPDAPGSPSDNQVKNMMKKLLASRFGLKSHDDKREMSAYVLTVTKSGPKLTKSEADPSSPYGFFFRGLGDLHVVNATMDDFANGMGGSVFDRPVVNHTDLEGRWDFTLKWTPDESQFQIFEGKIPPNDAADAPPPVFKAIQEQLGLKLDAAKTQVKVMAIDHVTKPSEN